MSLMTWLQRRMHRHFWMSGVTYSRGEHEACWRCLTCGEYQYFSPSPSSSQEEETR